MNTGEERRRRKKIRKKLGPEGLSHATVGVQCAGAGGVFGINVTGGCDAGVAVAVEVEDGRSVHLRRECTARTGPGERRHN
jgi:hypothetical protein